jgi:hypothetical protein
MKPGRNKEARVVLLDVYFFAYSSTLKIEAVCSSETSVYFYQATRLTITDDNTFYIYRSGNLASF